jgi:UV DNA damage endonuclease
MTVESHMDYRIGFACKIVADVSDKKQKQALESKLNTKSTTIAALRKLNKSQKIEKLYGIVSQNAEILANQMSLLASWPKPLRMMRISSDIWPGFTHEEVNPIYQEPLLQKAMTMVSRAGEIAKAHDIRLSMHPGQFTMLVSHTEPTVVRAIEDLEYHAEIFRRMGISHTDQRVEINIHGGARVPNFHEQFVNNWRKLAHDTQQWISVENDEYSYGIDDLLPLAPYVKLCIDVHHHWIHEESYLSPNDTMIPIIVESWRGARPEMHASTSHESADGHGREMPQFSTHAVKKALWRKHSDFCYNTKLNQYFLEFLPQFDIMVEAKMKNLASKQLLEQHQNRLISSSVN